MVEVNGHTAEFTFFRPQAGRVEVVGDFNGWRRGGQEMTPSGDGYWRARLTLPRGEFRFRYLADGRWFVDFASFGLAPGPFGPDSVVRVREEDHRQQPVAVGHAPATWAEDRSE